ncbi:DUF6612 family protein [Halobacterium yunchengense]|uniref:DUF6612 family protein n=1 Tax=Halobacterium yunchengense TaxID=3108497 RepID=UPI0030083739
MRVTALRAAAVAALLVTAGCAGLPGGDAGDGDRSAEQFAEDVQAAMSDVDTYRMTMQMNVSADGQSLEMRQTGAFDREAERARVNATAMGEETTTYIDGTTLYVQFGGEWQSQNLSETDVWNGSDSAARQGQVLASGDVTVEGGATVDGTETTVLRVDADPEELKEAIQQQSTSPGVGSLGIEEATYRMYVANETDRVRQVDLSMTMSANDQTMRANATMTFSDYGADVDVAVPDAATDESARVAAPDSSSVAASASPVVAA